MLPEYKDIFDQINQNKKLITKFGLPMSPISITSNREQVIDVENQLQEIINEVYSCKNCPLAAQRIKRRCKCVPGAGNSKALVMVVGEGPGKMEERYAEKGFDKRIGKPFVGPSGKLLDQILEYLTLDRDEVYVGNIINCRATFTNVDTGALEDRKPTPAEITACSYIHRQIKLIQPKLILALGKVSASALLGLSTDGDAADTRDKIFDYPHDKRIKVWTSYHPAYLLRNPGEMIPLSHRLKLLRITIQALKEEIKNNGKENSFIGEAIGYVGVEQNANSEEPDLSSIEI